MRNLLIITLVFFCFELVPTALFAAIFNEDLSKIESSSLLIAKKKKKKKKKKDVGMNDEAIDSERVGSDDYESRYQLTAV